MEERKASSSGTAEMRVGVDAEVVMMVMLRDWRGAGIHGRRKWAAVSKGPYATVHKGARLFTRYTPVSPRSLRYYILAP
jgi:hypothetical protein